MFCLVAPLGISDDGSAFVDVHEDDAVEVPSILLESE